MTDAAGLRRDLESADAELRRRAVSLILDAGPDDAVDLVVRALGDRDWRVRKEASQIAFALGPSAALIGRLIGLLSAGDDVGLRNAAVETLASFGRSVVAPIAAAVPRLDADGRKLAAEALGRAADPQAMPVLERLSRDLDPNVRATALEAIGELGAVAVDAASSVLVRALSADDVHMRLAALDGLNRLGVVVPWETLAPLVDDRILRRATLAAASRSGRIEAARALFGALEDESVAVFRLALLGLAELALDTTLSRAEWANRRPSLGARARERLYEVMTPDSGDVEARRAGLVVAAAANELVAIDLAIDALLEDEVAREGDAALRLFGSAALPRLLSRVAHGDAPSRAAAIGRLVDLTDRATEEPVRLALRAALTDPAPEVVAAALAALGAVGTSEDLAAVFSIVAGVQSTALAAAQGALAALARRYPEDARDTALVARADPDRRIATATVIGALGGDVLGSVSDDVAFLTSALSSADPRTRLAAVGAVGEVGSELGLEAVEYALADEEREVQLRSVWALGRLRGRGGRPVGGDRLVELVRDEADPDLAATAVRALGEARDPRAEGSLRPLALSSSPLVAVAAIETLGKLDAPARVDALIEAFGHPHPEVVKAAILALQGVRDARVSGAFARALEHSAWDVRRIAADCLGHVGGESTRALLEAKLASEGEPLVREALNRALGALEPPSTLRRTVTIAPPRGPA